MILENVDFILSVIRIFIKNPKITLNHFLMPVIGQIFRKKLKKRYGDYDFG